MLKRRWIGCSSHVGICSLLAREQIESALSGRPSATAAYVAETHSCFAVEAWLGQVSGGTAAANA